MHRMSGTKRSAKATLTERNSIASKAHLKTRERSAVALMAGRTKMAMRKITEVPIRKRRDSSGGENSKRIGRRRAKQSMFARKIHSVRRWFIQYLFYSVVLSL